MKQIIQDIKSGDTILETVPVPQVRAGAVLIRTNRTLVSLGTEKMLVEFGKANWIAKARQQPDKVKQVLDKIKTDGLQPTVEAVFRKLGEPLPLGYCNAGEVVAVGAGVSAFKIGDRVVSNGHHAEVVCVPQNLVAKIPDNVSYEEATFTVISAIALQGIRLINPTFGETVVVTGLGLIGLIAAQLLQANGCRVIGLDFDDKKIALAKTWGIEAFNAADNEVVTLVHSLTNGIGADAVLITASAKSDNVISEAAKMSRRRGRIVLVGVIGLDMQRADFYEKELTFQVSCSYGPGRYDENYEQKGQDYPSGLVRWTEKRNFEAVLQAIATSRLQVLPMITERINLDDYQAIYGNMGNNSSIASIICFNDEVDVSKSSIKFIDKNFENSKGVIGVIGAGGFTSSTVLPMLTKSHADIKTIASSKGLSGTILSRKHKIANTTTNYQDILTDDDIDTVVITTRHDQHAQMVIEALNANKHVFVEKPLALTHESLDRVEDAYKKSSKTLTVGFNRRFSPYIQKIKKSLGSSNVPINVIATMNVGEIPQSNWIQDMTIGGGRIIGEACHCVDYITYLTGSTVEAVLMSGFGQNLTENTDNAVMILKYKNGSQGIINYFSNGSKSYSKERVEVYCGGKTAIIDNFRKVEFYSFKESGSSGTQDKGHANQFKLFVERIKNGGEAIIPFQEIMNTSKTVIAAIESLKIGQWVYVDKV
jgi:predicted dehydrogenase/threonine dehydrogenase-like Zn-dependent dehydrogenase